jgi:hypothetical protein
MTTATTTMTEPQKFVLAMLYQCCHNTQVAIQTVVTQGLDSPVLDHKGLTNRDILIRHLGSLAACSGAIMESNIATLEQISAGVDEHIARVMKGEF